MDPTRDLMQMREEMDRLFNHFLGRGDGEEATWGEPPGGEGCGRRRSMSMRPKRPPSISCSMRPVRTERSHSGLSMFHDGSASSSRCLMSSHRFPWLETAERFPVWTSVKPPRRFLPWSTTMILPRASCSSRGTPSSGSYRPLSQIITVPAPYWPSGITPSKSADSSGWSSVLTASHFSAGFMDAPLGTAQDTRMALDLQPDVIVEATGAVLLNDERRLRPACRPGPGARPGPVGRRGVYVQQPICM